MISIIIPTINEERNIGKTLLKINSINEFSKAEIIIVDDNSEDDTLNIVESFKKKLNIKIIKNKNRLGLGYALNKGFKISKCPFVMFMDADLSLKTMFIKEINWLGLGESPPAHGIDVSVKVRSTQEPMPAKLYGGLNGQGKIELVEPEFGIAPGQAAVFYENTRLLGGGWIIKSESRPKVSA